MEPGRAYERSALPSPRLLVGTRGSSAASRRQPTSARRPQQQLASTAPLPPSLPLARTADAASFAAELRSQRAGGSAGGRRPGTASSGFRLRSGSAAAPLAPRPPPPAAAAGVELLGFDNGRRRTLARTQPIPTVRAAPPEPVQVHPKQGSLLLMLFVLVLLVVVVALTVLNAIPAAHP